MEQRRSQMGELWNGRKVEQSMEQQDYAWTSVAGTSCWHAYDAWNDQTREYVSQSAYTHVWDYEGRMIHFRTVGIQCSCLQVQQQQQQQQQKQ